VRLKICFYQIGVLSEEVGVLKIIIFPRYQNTKTNKILITILNKNLYRLGYKLLKREIGEKAFEGVC
jgi:hypothetical protein